MTVPGINQADTATMPKPPSKIVIDLYRRNGDIFLDFKTDEALEAIFKSKSSGVKESAKWAGLTFYTIPSLLDSLAYRRLLEEHNLFDDYGQSVVEEGKFNIAFLRTVGGKGTIKLNEEIPFAEASEAVRRMVQFVKRYYRDFMADYTVKGSVTVEV